ncbi:MAG: hypothetical protein GYA23_05380 [Methanomicrobiales archaeon]|nr:hypothetical protein [Methanomicrobiales archaeon]
MDYPLPPCEDPYLGKTCARHAIEVDRTFDDAFDLCLQYISTLESQVIIAADRDQRFLQVITPDRYTQILGTPIQFILRFELEAVPPKKTVIHYSSRYAPLGARGIESDRDGMNRKNIRRIGEYLEPFQVSYKE